MNQNFKNIHITCNIQEVVNTDLSRVFPESWKADNSRENERLPFVRNVIGPVHKDTKT